MRPWLEKQLHLIDFTLASLTSARGEIIGVAELINKRSGNFTESEKSRFAQMVLIGALALKGVHFPELRNETRAKLAHFVEPLKRSNET